MSRFIEGLETARIAGVHIRERLFSPNPDAPMMETYPELQELPRWPRIAMIIPDANGRWAEKFGKSPSFGHAFAVQNIIAPMARRTGELPIEEFIFWNSSHTNITERPAREVSYLLDLSDEFIVTSSPEIIESNRRFIRIGNREIIEARNPRFLAHLDELEEKTKDNTGQIIVMPVGFSGMDQQIRALQRAKERGLPEEITEKTFWSLQDGEGLVRSADLIIRTGGDYRLSDLGWLNGANTQPIFLTKKFPELREKDIVKALVQFSKTERRMGGRPTVEPQEFTLPASLPIPQS